MDTGIPASSDPAEGDAATLAGLRAEFPCLHIGTEFYGRARVWVARGDDGHPWLVASDDLHRFRSALGTLGCGK